MSVTNGTESKGLSTVVSKRLLQRPMYNSRFQKSCLLAFDSFPKRFSEANLDKVLYFSVYGMSDGL